MNAIGSTFPYEEAPGTEKLDNSLSWNFVLYGFTTFHAKQGSNPLHPFV